MAASTCAKPKPKPKPKAKAKAKAKAAFQLDARRDAVGGVAGPAVNPSMGAHKAPSMAPYGPATPPTPSPVDRGLVCGLRAKACEPWIGLDSIGLTRPERNDSQTELSRHDLRVGWRESHAMRGWGTGDGKASASTHGMDLPKGVERDMSIAGAICHTPRIPALPTARTGHLAGGCRVARAGTVRRHGWRLTSPHGWVHGGSRAGLPGALPPVPSRRHAVGVGVTDASGLAVAVATTKNKNGHPRGYPFQ